MTDETTVRMVPKTINSDINSEVRLFTKKHNAEPKGPDKDLKAINSVDTVNRSPSFFKTKHLSAIVTGKFNEQLIGAILRMKPELIADILKGGASLTLEQKRNIALNKNDYQFLEEQNAQELTDFTNPMQPLLLAIHLLTHTPPLSHTPLPDIKYELSLYNVAKCWQAKGLRASDKMELQHKFEEILGYANKRSVSLIIFRLGLPKELKPIFDHAAKSVMQENSAAAEIEVEAAISRAGPTPTGNG